MPDPVFDCATADNLGQRWSGIEITPMAVGLVNTRLQQSMGDPFPQPTGTGP